MKYRYVRITRKFVVSFCLLSFFVLFVNILGLSRYGLISIPNFLLVLSSFIGTILTTAYIISGYEEFDLDGHKKLIEEIEKVDKDQLPTVDVFLPCAGEDLETLERTYSRVGMLNYPPHKLNVYVLDDKGDVNVERLSKKYNFHYLSRPNKGEKKKAGNLKFGMEHSNGEHILILDADFAPSSEMLYELLPYLQNNKKVGIVQSPQDFILNKDEPAYLQKGDIGVQEFFYRICEVARNTYNSSICVGTNAIYRRSALVEAGGFYQIDHSEDAHTGLNLIKNGYRILYIPVVLATGYCPSNYYQLFKQRSRWCLGSLTLMRSKLFWNAKLSFMSRICYFSGFYYYLNSLVIVLLPFHTLYLLSTPEKSSLVDTFFFLPNIIYLLLSYSMYYYPRFNFAVLGNQFFFSWTYLFVTVKDFILGKKEEWVPTGALQKKNNSYKTLVWVVFVYILIYWGWFISIITKSDFRFVASDYILVFWIVYNMICQISFIAGLVIVALNKPKAKTFTENIGTFIHLLPTER